MSDPFVVEVWGEPAGIVFKEGTTFRFQALAHPFFPLERTRFRSPGHARLAAAQLRPSRLALPRAN